MSKTSLCFLQLCHIENLNILKFLLEMLIAYL